MGKPRVRVLVVDDYEGWRMFAAKTLQEKPELDVVSEASDGLEAVQKAQDLKPDLILLDIGLPNLNGIEAARRIRRFLPNSKILFCSSNRSPDVAEAALGAGAEGYVVKSDAASDLLAAVTSVLLGKRFVSRTLASHDFAGTSQTHLVREQGHVVQFYTDDAVLLDGLSAFFRRSLGEGNAVVAVVTSSHRHGLERSLIAQNIDLSEAIRNGWICLLDADQALNEFMDLTGPSRERFLSHFGDLIRRAQAAAVAKSRRVVVFGEMVSVLWAQKKYDAAVRLEELWNELALECPFYLCCAYPASAFHEASTAGQYATICAQHSDIVSAF